MRGEAHSMECPPHFRQNNCRSTWPLTEPGHHGLQAAGRASCGAGDLCCGGLRAAPRTTLCGPASSAASSPTWLLVTWPCTHRLGDLPRSCPLVLTRQPLLAQAGVTLHLSTHLPEHPAPAVFRADPLQSALQTSPGCRVGARPGAFQTAQQPSRRLTCCTVTTTRAPREGLSLGVQGQDPREGAGLLQEAPGGSAYGVMTRRGVGGRPERLLSLGRWGSTQAA